jgi:hypothetical protein
MTEREFAVCANTFEGCACPAVAAGFDPDNDHSIEIAEQYDYFAGGDARTIPEKNAKSAWLEAIHDLRETNRPKSADLGEEIAIKLGWMEDNE